MSLHYCDQTFSSCGEWELLFIVSGLLLVVISLSVGHGLYGAGFSSYGTWAQQLWHMGLVVPWYVGSLQTRD